MLDRRSAPEEIFKRFKLDAVAPVPLDELIRACADGLGVEVMTAVDQRFGHDGVAMVAQVAQQHSVRAGGGDLNGFVVDHVDFDDIVIVQADLREAFGPFQRSLDVFYRHGFAVVELDALLDLKLPFVFADGFIALHQVGFGFQIHAAPEQGIISQQVHVRAGHGVVLSGRKRRGFVGGGDDDAVLDGAAGGRTAFLLLVVACGGLVAAVGGLLLFLAASGKQAKGHDQNQQQAERPQFFVHVSHLI